MIGDQVRGRRRGARLWTADRRLLGSLAGSRWGGLAAGVTAPLT